MAPRRRLDTAGDDGIGSDGTPEAPQIALIEARDLLGTEELVHVGRGVRPRPAEHDDAE
jgi:hypothetical protein